MHSGNGDVAVMVRAIEEPKAEDPLQRWFCCKNNLIYEDAVQENKIEPNITKVCAGKWFNYATPIEGRRIVGCNTRELKLALSN